MNKYYEMFINETVDESILKVNNNSLSFEDHFWHFACLSLYYKNNKQFYLHKKSLVYACDLNYYYNAMIFFDACGVLPSNYKKYVKPFEHKMKNDKLELLIEQTNKRDKKDNFKDFLIYSLGSLLVLPIMLILVFVFKMESTTACIIAIIGLLLGQTFISPFKKQRKQIKYQKIESMISKEERMYFDYLLMFYNLLKDQKLVALVKSENDEEKNIIIECIKKNKPLPESIINKDKKIKKNKKNKES
jgi:hypothetical protein